MAKNLWKECAMLSKRTKTIAAVVTLAAFTQTACYNTYFISKSELEKLESSVEPKEVVEVYGDCEGVEAAHLSGDAPLYAQNEASTEADETAAEAPEETASDAAPAETAEAAEVTGEEAAETTTAPPGCTLVQVSTANALYILKKNGEEQRVTPFNFIMSQGQVVSPEYNLLETLDDVEGAEVDEFSTWKTVGTIVGVSAVAIGTFVGISLAGGNSGGFSAQQ